MWDEAKNRKNQRKHRVSFEEACNYSGRTRTTLSAASSSSFWTERDEDAIGIISARWAEEPERALDRAHLGESQ